MFRNFLLVYTVVLYLDNNPKYSYSKAKMLVLKVLVPQKT